MTRTAVVTGGAQGIGLGCVRRLQEDGWRVAALDADAEALAALNEAARGSRLLTLEADVSDEAAVVDGFERVAAWSGGGLDLLVNNAGIADPVSGPVEALSLAEWRRRLDVNLTGAFLCVRSAVPLLRARRGAVVNVSSTRAAQSEPHCEAYAAAKGGLEALTHALAISLGPEIRVNGVAPGWIAAQDWAKPSRRAAPDLDPEDHAQHPVGRVGAPADVAAAVAFLAGEDAGFVTGQTVVVDGGMTRRMIYRE